MKRYRDLVVYTKDCSLDQFIRSLEDCLPEKWKRDESNEKGFSAYSDKKIYCFRRSKEDYIDSSLWLAEISESELKVTNIVPTAKSELSISEYNTVLQEFVTILDSVKKIYIDKIYTTSEEYTLESISDMEVEKSLRAFSNLANKADGGHHPMDRARWNKFIVLAFKNEPRISSDELEKFLLSEGWSVTIASDLAIEYEFGISLLSSAERQGDN